VAPLWPPDDRVVGVELAVVDPRLLDLQALRDRRVVLVGGVDAGELRQAALTAAGVVQRRVDLVGRGHDEPVAVGVDEDAG
jgi:hypothetical protein